MDAIILTVVLRTILTIITVWNTGETGDTYCQGVGEIFTTLRLFRFG